MEARRDYKPHAVCIPCPGQSHIKAMLKLAKLLHHKGFHITFVNFETIHKRFLESRGHTHTHNNNNNSSSSLDGFFPDFRFETLPDTLLSPSFCENIITNVMLQPFLELLAKLNRSSSSSSSSTVSCIISDAFMPFTISAGHQLGVPVVMFFTVSACHVMATRQFRTLKDKGLTPVKDRSCFTREYLETVIDWIPGMRDIRIRDLPGSVRITDPDDIMFNYIMDSAENASKASGIIIHTFDALESQVLDALSAMFPNLLTIGPLQLLLNQIEEQDGMLSSIGYSLWREETECLQWLDSKEPKSVIYVNFGSVVVITEQQLVEVAMGIVNSNHPFLLIIRPGLVIGDAQQQDLPTDFEVKTKGKGFIASWCPQEEVLNHPSIGGFITHSGWGSTIESLSAGMPMICRPFEGDQMINCRYTCTEWGVGMEINGEEVKRSEVEKLVRELMEGDKGEQMRRAGIAWKKLADEAAAPDGSSSRNLEKLVTQILKPKEHMKLI